ncbi:uncharacterized protein BO97DRAFT_374770 [Aspergillus homomorphus CBS 101889]|uniref:ER transporter 6TM N-terminal domain-containing protein n=1 Tax=Aspergillus homomorphus (strain CBS 101889) TaxID=1450537 RepID=A0A395HN56_ASPHC|nr:hypothetical protein BO97DRAFT_374770 [Aspergillus homomorphus CBS 101889]RAL09361.1 hypothetical protein BO97DRAFT_374770 [Aspergillus homomorphus CBS 101889]
MGDSHEPSPRHDVKPMEKLQETVFNGGKKRLPPFLDHFNARDLKILFRCWVAAWVACLLFLINPSLSSLGTATFFACLVLLMLPPSSVVFIYLLGSLSLYLGVCLAWAWGVITMKAAYAARPAADTQAQLLALEQTAAQQANATGQPVASLAQVLVYEGHMLDARVTAVTYCLVCTFIYFMARLRASNPKATFTAIFGIIIADLFLIFIPLLPSFNGTLPLTLAKPAGVGIGLGFACSVLFFPQSTSRIILNSMEDIIELLTHPLAFTMATLGKRDPDLDMAQLRKTQVGIIGEYRKMEPALAFLPLDFSIGCWGAQHVGTLKEPVRQAVSAILSLLEFHMNRVSGKARAKEVLLKYVDQIALEDEKEVRSGREVGRHQLQQTARLLDGLRNADTEPIPEEALQAFVRTASKAIEACVAALAAAKDCIHMANGPLLYRRPSSAAREELCERSRRALEDLRAMRQIFIQDTTDSLVSCYGPLLEGKSGEDGDRHAKNFGGIVVGMVFEELMANAMSKTEDVLAQVLDVFQSSQRTRVWWPLSLKAFVSWVSGKGNKAPAMAPVADDDPEEQLDATKSVQERLRLSRGYRVKRRGLLSRIILGTYHWFTSNEGLYALRMVVVTIALGIVSALPSTAGFFYREKGIWALIMAQTGLLPYMADFIFSVIARVLGTIVGGVLGLLAWYIGSGTGPGSPYGLAAIMAIMLVIFLWTRLYLPPNLLQGSIMGGATFLLVVAYSYDDTHVPTYGNPGVGYTVFWRRLLLVLIGIGAGTIVQLFPHPPSAAKHISKTLSATIRAISDHYALLLSCWGRGQEDGRILAEPISLQMAESLLMLDGPIQLLRYEFSSSRFDSANMDEVKRLCHGLNRNLGRLLSLSASLPRQYQDRLARLTGLLDHRCIGEIMAVLSVCEQALKTGDAPPELLPTPLVQRSMEYWHTHAMDILLAPDMLRDEHYRRYCVGLSAYVRFLSIVDELVLVIKGVLGESHLVAWEEAGV